MYSYRSNLKNGLEKKKKKSSKVNSGTMRSSMVSKISKNTSEKGGMTSNTLAGTKTQSDKRCL